MSDLHGLADEQMARLEPFLPKRHGKPCLATREEPGAAGLQMNESIAHLPLLSLYSIS